VVLLKQGEKIHLITRRRFEGDLRWHFVGEVQASTDTTARVEGYTFVFDSGRNEFVKRPETRVRIFGLADSGNIINIIPEEVDIRNVFYRLSAEKCLVVTDDRSFSLDVNEFSQWR
jgi:hypothetical protein